jgi:hypothetical protein
MKDTDGSFVMETLTKLNTCHFSVIDPSDPGAERPPSDTPCARYASLVYRTACFSLERLNQKGIYPAAVIFAGRFLGAVFSAVENFC